MFIHKCFPCSCNVPGPDPGEIKQTMSMSFWDLSSQGTMWDMLPQGQLFAGHMKPADWPELSVHVRAQGCSLRTAEPVVSVCSPHHEWLTQVPFRTPGHLPVR